MKRPWFGAALVLFNAVFAAGLTTLEHGSPAAYYFVDVMWTGVNATAAVQATRAARSTRRSPAGPMWLFLAAAMWFATLAMVVWSYEELVRGNFNPSPGVTDVMTLITLVFVIAAFWRLRATTTAKRLLVLEVGLSLSLLGLVGAALVFPQAGAALSGVTLAAAVVHAVVAPASLIFLSLAIIAPRLPLSPRVFALLLLGSGAMLGTEMLYGYALINSSYKPGAVFDALWGVAFSLVAWAAAEQAAEPPPPEDGYANRAGLSRALFWGGAVLILGGGLALLPEKPPRPVAAVFVMALCVLSFIVARWEMLVKREHAAAQALADAVRARDDFMVLATHELRTPLTVLRLQADAFRAMSGAPKPEFDIAPQVDRLQRVVDSLLDVAATRAGGLVMRKTPFDVSALVTGRVEQRREHAAQPIALRGHAPGAVVVGDQARLSRVIDALLDNALKFGEGKPIEVTMTLGAGSVRVAIIDHGMGMSETERLRAFTPFEHPAPVTKYAGLGANLYLARATLAAHGGELNVADTPGGGLTVEIVLPVDPSRTS